MSPAMPAPLTHTHCEIVMGFSLKLLHRWEFVTAEVDTGSTSHSLPCLPLMSKVAFPKNENRNSQPEDRTQEKHTNLQTVLTIVKSSISDALLTYCFQVFLASTLFFSENSITNNFQDMFSHTLE